MAEISEKSFPFDSEEYGGKYDREYVAEDFARYFRAFISSGIFLEESTNLQVIANGDMSVTLKPGSLIIDGYRYDNVKDIKIQLDPADGVMNRIDRIAGTWSKADRDIHYTLQRGEMSYQPVPKAARRTAEYRDYVLADIYVKAGAIDITQKDITDQRLDSDVCGLAIPFGKLDTSTLSAQLQAFYKHVVESHEEWGIQMQGKFESWFETVKNQLSGDAAGNLQNQIGNLSDLSTQDKSNLVAAINEAKDSMPALTTSLAVTEEGVAALDGTVGKVLDDKISALKQSFGGMTFGIDDDGNYGYIKAGADTVIPFKKNIERINLGGYNSKTAQTINVKNYTDKWADFTTDNFFLNPSSINFDSSITSAFGNNLSYSYNNQTGVLSVSKYIRFSSYATSINYSAYLVY